MVLLAAALPVAALGAGCVVPIPGEELVPDGGVNSTPVIADSTPPMPGPIDIDSATLPSVTITFRDNDLDQVLHYRVFRDYDKARLAPLIDRAVASEGDRPERVVTVETATWCQGATSGALLVFDVVVADDAFIDDLRVKPEYRALEPGAESSVRSWIGRCP